MAPSQTVGTQDKQADKKWKKKPFKKVKAVFQVKARAAKGKAAVSEEGAVPAFAPWIPPLALDSAMEKRE